MTRQQIGRANSFAESVKWMNWLDSETYEPSGSPSSSRYRVMGTISRETDMEETEREGTINYRGILRKNIRCL